MTSDSNFEALRDIYPISREVFERLELCVARLGEWQRKTNLIAPSTFDEIWHRHVGDSLQLLAIKPEARNWLDLGSGGGFPGLVITAVMADEENASVTMVESNNKKTSFLRQVNRQIGGHAKVITERIENAVVVGPNPEIVTARALTALPNLLNLSSRWLESGAIGLFHKGREYEAELSECYGLWGFDLIKHESKISTESVVLELTNLVQKAKQSD